MSIKVQIDNDISNNNKLALPIPDAISELMGWNKGDVVEVPFHKIIKISGKTVESKSKITSVKNKVTVKFGNYEREITRNDVIRILENPPKGIEKYRTAFIIHNGTRYGVKNICKELFIGLKENFNTIQGERYLNKLGFETYREE